MWCYALSDLLEYTRKLALKAINYSKIEEPLRKIVSFDKEKQVLVIGNDRIRLEDRSVYILGAGKASGAMAKILVETLGDNITGGIIALPHGSSKYYSEIIDKVKIIEAGHPIPDDGSLKAGEEIYKLAESLDEKSITLAVISGGGSALMEKPIPPVTLDDLKKTSKLLLSSGASIDEINCVRKHLSLLKGGRLAAIAYPACVYGFYVSDVPGDRFDTIASGPTVPDPTTYSDAVRIMKFYEIWDKIPERVQEVLNKGVQGEIPESPKPGDIRMSTTKNYMVLRNIDVLRKLAEDVKKDGYNALILTSRLEGESREVAKTLASITLEILERGIPVKPPAIILAGGETSVTVRNPEGQGGRNQELALAFAIKIRGFKEIALAAIDTDGIDGNTEVAGAVVDYRTYNAMREKGIVPEEYLSANNSYKALKEVGLVIDTGFTHTNVNSMVFIAIKRPSPEEQ